MQCYEGCDAPLCPLEPDVFKRIWFCDEEVCRKRGLKLDWLKTQKKIARKAINKLLFFRVADLKKIKNVHKGIRGHNPEARTHIA